MGEFEVIGDASGNVLTYGELRECRVMCVDRSTEEDLVGTATLPKAMNNQEIELEVLVSNCCRGKGRGSEVSDVAVRCAWLLSGGEVVRELARDVDITADGVTVGDPSDTESVSDAKK